MPFTSRWPAIKIGSSSLLPSYGDAGNPSVNSRRQKRSNETRRSTTGPDTRLAR